MHRVLDQVDCDIREDVREMVQVLGVVRMQQGFMEFAGRKEEKMQVHHPRGHLETKAEAAPSLFGGLFDLG